MSDTIWAAPQSPPFLAMLKIKGVFLVMPSQYTDYRVSQKKFITFTFLISQEFWSNYKFILKKTLFGTPCRFQSKGFHSHKISSKISGARCDFVVRKWEWHVWSKRFFLNAQFQGKLTHLLEGQFVQKGIEIVHFFKFCGRKRLVNKSPLGLFFNFFLLNGKESAKCFVSWFKMKFPLHFLFLRFVFPTSWQDWQKCFDCGVSFNYLH